MHTNSRQFKPTLASPSPSPLQPRQENSASPFARRALLKEQQQDGGPVRSPFHRLSNNKTVKQRLPSSAVIDGSYTEEHRGFLSQLSGSQLSKPGTSDYRHSLQLQSVIKPPLSQASRFSLPSASAVPEEYSAEHYGAPYQGTDASYLYDESRNVAQRSLQKELVSSPIPSGADNYDRILDTEVLSRQNAQFLSDNERASSISSAGPPIDSSLPAEPRRSKSKEPHATEVQGSDSDVLSVLAGRAFAEKQSLREALGKKDEELAQLSTHVNAITREKEELLNNVKTIKHKAKENLSSFRQRLEILESRVQEQTETTVQISENMRISMKTLDDVKHEVEKTNQNLGDTIDENGIYMPTQEWRATIENMRLESANKKHMIDMFRDKLEFAQGELAEAKNRLDEFEGKQARDGQVIESAYRQIDNLNAKLHELGATLKSQFEGNGELLVKQATLQTLLETRGNELKKFEEALDSTQKNLDDARERLQDKEVQLKVLQEWKTDAETKLLKVEGEELKIRGQIASQESLQQQLALLAKDVDNLTSIRSQLENDLEREKTRVEAEIQFRSKIVQENTERIAKIDSLTNHGSELRLKLKESDIRNETLQERLDGQTLMLTMEKNTHGDLQEKHFAAEKTHRDEVESMKRSYELVIATLERELKTSEADRACKAKEYSESLANAKTGFKEQLTFVNERLGEKTDTIKRISDELNGLASKHDEQVKTNQKLHGELLQAQKALEQVEQPSQSDAVELQNLKNKCSDALKKIDDLEDRARSLEIRFKKGDLSPEERALIDSVLRSAQSSHEQQLQAKTIEINKRDNIIKALEKKQGRLETELARSLNQQKFAGNDNDAGKNKSLIDLDQWATSSPPRRRSSMQEAEDDLSGSDTPVAKGRIPKQGTNALTATSSNLPKTGEFKNRSQAKGGHADPFDEIPKTSGVSVKRKYGANAPEKDRGNARTTRSRSRGIEDIGGSETHAGTHTHEEGNEPKTKPRKRRC